MKTDTIAAIATALSESGIGIIRISGEDAVLIVNKLYRSKNGKRTLSEFKSHTIHYGFLYDEDDFLDEVMVSVMLSPNSYTTENTVEINCHGGIFVLNRILQAILKNGARLAEPGEFTKRAFLNGRIDLSRAEAVMDMISSKNEFARKSSAKQLRGSVYTFIKNIREKILFEIAFIESALDDPEHISLDDYYGMISKKVDDMLFDLQNILDKADNGRILKNGISTVIVGKPNAGKSSLLNLLAGEERAIVTDIAGTTRDTLEEQIRFNGIVLNVVDTAGIHATDDIVERIGVNRAKKSAQDADLILCVVDSSVPLDKSDEDIFSLIFDKKIIILLNKTDLEPIVTEEMIRSFFDKTENVRIIKTSTKENIGMDLLGSIIQEMFLSGKVEMEDEVIITSLRHKEKIQDAFASLSMVKQSILNEMPEDFLSIDLMNAYSSLGYIIGEEVEDDLINEIFSKFCMGK